jgi:6-phosphogluconolactonase (cycloisomerase 2 family)
MRMIVRAFLSSVVGLATMSIVGCGHYKCGTTFGNATCATSGGGISQGGGTSTNAAYVFAVDTSARTMDGYTLDTTANTLSPTASYIAPTIPADMGAGMVVAQGKYLYAAFRTTDQIYGWTISSGGVLTTVSGSPYTAAFLTSINAGAVGQQNMIANPAGTLLFFSDPVTNSIYVYQIGSGGVLTAAVGSPFAAPISPLNLTTDGKGKYLYATDGFFGTHTGAQVAAFTIGSSGALASVAGSPFAYPMWQVEGEPSGLYLIGTTGNSKPSSLVDDDHLYVFSINQSTGAITQVGVPVPTVYSPFTIAVQSNAGGSLVYSFGINDTDTGYNPIEGYQISSTGSLTAVSGSPFSGVSNGFWGQFDQSGAFLFDYSSVVQVGTNNVVTTLGALDVGSGGALTQPTSAVPLVTGGYWVVTDAP